MRTTKIISASIDIELWNKFCSIIDNVKQNEEVGKKKITKSSVFEEAINRFINKNKPNNE
jgi:hypothetical protein